MTSIYCLDVVEIGPQHWRKKKKTWRSGKWLLFVELFFVSRKFTVRFLIHGLFFRISNRLFRPILPVFAQFRNDFDRFQPDCLRLPVQNLFPQPLPPPQSLPLPPACFSSAGVRGRAAASHPRNGQCRKGASEGGSADPSQETLKTSRKNEQSMKILEMHHLNSHYLRGLDNLLRTCSCFS